jgi:hypothetical protein
LIVWMSFVPHGLGIYVPDTKYGLGPTCHTHKGKTHFTSTLLSSAGAQAASSSRGRLSRYTSPR